MDRKHWEVKEFYTTIQKCTISILVRYITNRIGNNNMIEELQIKNFTELCRKYTGIHFSLEISLNWLILCSIAQQPQESFL